MIKQKEVIKILKESEALLEGHFLLSSGRHADRYIQCAQVLQYPWYTKELAEGIADIWSEYQPEVVVGPAMGGVVLAYAVGQALNRPAIFSERKEGEMKFRRGFSLEEGQRVLVVEDVVTTGGSVKELLRIIEAEGAEIIGISSIVDRSNGKAEFKYPFQPLLQLEVPSFEESECPICQKEKTAPIKPGSRN
ncbi:MAG: orotate phosphoribosyltransferase [Bacillota bacterium]